MKELPRNNKRGVTLVEVVIGVFVLSIFALGILSLLIYNNQAVSDSAIKKTDTSAAVQKLDTIIAAVSNSFHPENPKFDANVSYLTMGDDGKVHIDIDQLRQDFGMSDTEAWKIKDELDPDPTDSPTEPLRGWYITLTYTVKRDDKDCVTEVKGYTSCSQGEFDKEDVQ